MNGHCDVNGLDIRCFVAAVLGQVCARPLQMTDCNGNQTPDDQDIATGASADVNTNGIPDECESQQAQGSSGGSSASGSGAESLVLAPGGDETGETPAPQGGGGGEASAATMSPD